MDTFMGIPIETTATEAEMKRAILLGKFLHRDKEAGIVAYQYGERVYIMSDKPLLGEQR